MMHGHKNIKSNPHRHRELTHNVKVQNCE